MSAAIAMPPSPAPHDRRTYTDLAPATTTSQSLPRMSSNPTASSATPSQKNPVTVHATPSATTAPSSRSPTRQSNQQATNSSPPSAVRNGIGNPAPKIMVKKEPGSPELATTTRHRPRRLDLSKGSKLAGSGAATARPALGRDSLGIQEVGLACLSPGFSTQDPIMKAQLQQSMDVREQQRRIIEARLQQQSGKGDGHDGIRDKDNQFAAKTPGMSRRNKAPPGLTIHAPSHEQFANERVIQSAPLGQTFTGRHHPYPPGRQPPSDLANASHIQHVPAQQTANRLPPFHDVFGRGNSTHQEATRQLHPTPGHAPMTSPGLPPTAPSQPPLSGRSREYKSAEEAQHDMAGGRQELLPKIVHYTGHQPPTPPSPRNGVPILESSRSTSKRRTRAEYEEGGSPPLGHGPSTSRRGPFGAGRDSPETQRQKRDRFLKICEEAWDLFHS